MIKRPLKVIDHGRAARPYLGERGRATTADNPFVLATQISRFWKADTPDRRRGTRFLRLRLVSDDQLPSTVPSAGRSCRSYRSLARQR